MTAKQSLDFGSPKDFKEFDMSDDLAGFRPLNEIKKDEPSNIPPGNERGFIRLFGLDTLPKIHEYAERLKVVGFNPTSVATTVGQISGHYRPEDQEVIRAVARSLGVQFVPAKEDGYCVPYQPKVAPPLDERT